MTDTIPKGALCEHDTHRQSVGDPSSFDPCQWPATGRTLDGRLACGVHIRWDRYNAARDEQRHLERVDEDAAHERAHGYVDELVAMGFGAVPHWDPTTERYTGGVSIGEEAVIRLIALLALAEHTP